MCEPRCEHRALSHARSAGHHDPTVDGVRDQQLVEPGQEASAPHKPACLSRSSAKLIASVGSGGTPGGASRLCPLDPVLATRWPFPRLQLRSDEHDYAHCMAPISNVSLLIARARSGYSTRDATMTFVARAMPRRGGGQQVVVLYTSAFTLDLGATLIVTGDKPLVIASNSMITIMACSMRAGGRAAHPSWAGRELWMCDRPER